MKRILSSLLICLILLSLLSVYALAEGTPTLSVSDGGDAEPGEEITLTVDISDNPGIAAFTMKVTYDEERLELTKVKHTGMGGGTWLVNEDSVGWFAFHDYDYDGELLKLSFTVKDDAPNGDASVSIGYTDGNIGNFDEETVYFDVEAGGVTVNNGTEAPAENNEQSEEENNESTDSGNHSESSAGDNPSDSADSETTQTENSNQTSSAGGNSQSTVTENENASVVTESVSESERNSSEDDTDDADGNEEILVEEVSVLPAEDAMDETTAEENRVDEDSEEENSAEENEALGAEERTSARNFVSVKTHNLLWLWIVLGVLILALGAAALYLFVFKKDTGRH